MQFLVVSFIKLNIKPVLAVRNDIVIDQQPTHPPFRPLQKNEISQKRWDLKKNVLDAYFSIYSFIWSYL